jgi:quercetin dioxygenase-like cupin family protein
MKSTHALDETCEAAALYALGDLSAGDAAHFEQRLESGCPLCLAELEFCQETVESVLLAAPPVKPSPDLESRLLARIGASPQTSAPKIVRPGDGKWRQVAPGVTTRMLHEDRTMLVRMYPGASLPAHPHNAEEQCLVLEGTIEDADGNSASAGDFIVMEKGSRHPSIRSRNGALFLVAYT